MHVPDIPGHHHLHHLLWECYAAMIPVADDAFEQSELTLPLAGTLDLIGASPGATVADLSRMQPKTQQAISQLVSKLEKLGLLERRLGTGRGVGLHLTAAGEAARIESGRREELIEERLRDILGSDTFEDLRAMLERTRARFEAQGSTQLDESE